MDKKENLYINTNILVIDDVSFYYSLISDHLKIIGFQGSVFKATNVLDGIDMLKEQRAYRKSIDLIICDLKMPKFSGIDLIKTVRKSKHFSKIPIMIFTSIAENKQIVEAVQAGANTYLMKPWEASQLKEKLNESLAGETIYPEV